MFSPRQENGQAESQEWLYSIKPISFFPLDFLRMHMILNFLDRFIVLALFILSFLFIVVCSSVFSPAPLQAPMFQYSHFFGK